MIYYLEQYSQKLEVSCFGNRNPGVLELRNVFINKKKLFKWRPIIRNSLENEER